MMLNYFNKPDFLNAKLNIICALLILTIFIVDLQIPLGVAGGVPYIVVILVSLWSPKQYFMIHLAIICSLMIFLGFHLSPPGGELWKVMTNRVLALFAIWVTVILVFRWKRNEHELYSINQRMEKEKEKIYQATIHGAQHITNNLLNGLKIIELEIENHPDFDKKTMLMFDGLLANATVLMKDLSSVDEIDDEAIRKSVYPKEST